MSAHAESRIRIGDRSLASLVGLICAPFIGGTTMLFLSFGAEQPLDWLFTLFFSFAMSICFGVPASLLIGWPVHLALLYFRAVRWWWYVAFGAIIGAGVVFAASSSMDFELGQIDSLSITTRIGASVFGLGAGAIGGFVFWLVRRPDRDRNQSAKRAEVEP